MKPICTHSIAALLCLCSMAPLASAQGSYSTTLSDNKLSHTFDCKDFELVIQGEPYDDGDGGGLMLSLVMNNQSPDYFTLVVFNDSFDYLDKVKKFKNPKIKFDNEKAEICKRFTRKKKEEREPLDYARFETYPAGSAEAKALNDEVAVVASKESLHFVRIAVPYGSTCNFHLPVFYSDKNSSKEVKISNWATFDFKVTVDGSAQPDAELQDIESQFAGLGIDPQKPLFCESDKHPESLENQKVSFISQLTILKSRAETLRNRYAPQTKRWTAANDLIQRIDTSIDLVNGDDLHYTCSKCKIGPHQCQYCGHAVRDLQSLATKVSNSGSATKAQKNQAAKMLKCAKYHKVNVQEAQKYYYTIVKPNHHCKYCGHAVRDLQSLATKVSNSGSATQAQKDQAAEMLKCAKYHKDNVQKAQEYYNTIVGIHKPCSYCNYSQDQFNQKIASLAMMGKQAKAEANKLLECAKAHRKAGKTFMKFYNSIK